MWGGLTWLCLLARKLVGERKLTKLKPYHLTTIHRESTYSLNSPCQLKPLFHTWVSIFEIVINVLYEVSNPRHSRYVPPLLICTWVYPPVPLSHHRYGANLGNTMGQHNPYKLWVQIKQVWVWVGCLVSHDNPVPMMWVWPVFTGLLLNVCQPLF